MQVSTLLSLLLSATCLLISTLLLTTSFPTMSLPLSSLPTLVEQHTQVMLASLQHLCKSMFCLCVCVCARYVAMTAIMKFSESCKFETTYRRGTANWKLKLVKIWKQIYIIYNPPLRPPSVTYLAVFLIDVSSSMRPSCYLLMTRWTYPWMWDSVREWKGGWGRRWKLWWW